MKGISADFDLHVSVSVLSILDLKSSITIMNQRMDFIQP